MHMATADASSVRFPDRLRLRTPRGLPAAVEFASKRRNTTPAEWARQALLRSLEAEGIQLVSGKIVECGNGTRHPTRKSTHTRV